MHSFKSISQSSTRDTEKYAFVTLVMRGDAYVIGALVLAKSFRMTKTIHQIVCMVTCDVSQEAVELLRQGFDRVVLIEYINMPCLRLNTEKQENMYGAWTHLSLTCFRCLLLEEYAKVCLIDSDVVILRNMDNIFELPAPAASFYTFWGKKKVYTGLYHGGRVSAREISRALRTPGSFVCTINCLLLAPSKDLADQFVKCMEQFARRNGNCIGFRGVNSCTNDQMITHFYTNFMKIPWTHIGIQYQTIPWKERPMHDELPYLFHYFNINPWTMDLQGGGFPDLAVWWTIARMVCDENRLIRNWVPKNMQHNLDSLETYSPGECFWCLKKDHEFCRYLGGHFTILCPQWKKQQQTFVEETTQTAQNDCHGN